MSERDREQIEASSFSEGSRSNNQPPVVRIMPVLDEMRPKPALPKYMSASAAGIDLQACVAENVELRPGEFTIIPTGLRMAIPEGYEGQVRPRSGLAAKFGITVLNSPGTIDADYRGEVGVVLINLGTDSYTIANGDRVAQLVVAPVVQAEILGVTSLDDTDRGDGGFGSTGISGADGKRCTDGKGHGIQA